MVRRRARSPLLLIACVLALAAGHPATSAAPAAVDGAAPANVTRGCVDRFDPTRDYFPDKATVEDAVNFSVYRDSPPAAETAMTYSTEALRRFNEGLGGVSDRELLEGRIG